MSQETKPQEEQNNLETEDKQRKLLAVLLIILLLAGGALYYMNSSKQDTMNSSQSKIVQAQSSVKKENKTVRKHSIKHEKQKKTVTTISTSSLVKPTDRSSLLKLAMARAGRVDPFSESTPRMEAGISVNGRQFKNIDIVPVSGGHLPAPPGLKLPFGGDLFKNFRDMMGKKIKNLPNIGLPNDLTKLFTQQPADFEIKGFIGKKVIVSVNGMEEAVGKNETFEGVKVVSVDPGSLKAVFKVKSQTITKNIKSLTDVSDREDIKLVNFK